MNNTQRRAISSAGVQNLPVRKVPSKEAITQIEAVPSGYRDYVHNAEQSAAFEYWRIIRRRKGTLILAAFIGIVAGILVTLPQTPVYEARTSLEIQDLNLNFMDMKQVNPVDASGSYSALSDLKTQTEILQSEALLDAVVKKLNRDSSTNLKPQASRFSAWRRALNLPDATAVDAKQVALEAAKRSIKVRPLVQTRIIQVLVDSTDPKLAAAFANALVNEFIDENIQARWSMAQRTAEWLSRQLDEMRIKLERSEDALQSYAQRTGLVFTDEKTSVSEEKLHQLQQSLSLAQADRIAKQSRFEVATHAAPESLADILDDSTLRTYAEKTTELRRERAEESAIYAPGNSRIKKLDAQIATLQAALQNERDLILKRIQNDFEEARRRENLLSADYNVQARLLSQENERSIQYNILKREVDSNRQIYDAMLTKVKEATVASAMRASNVRIIDPARVPKLPYKPRRKVNAAVGLLVGLGAGLLLIITLERSDCTIQNPTDSTLYLDLPELGVIPADLVERGQLQHRINRSSGLSSDSSARQRPELITWERKPSVTAEAFRAALTSILFSGQNGHRPKVLVMSSASPGEGKTTVACNLAIAMAEIRQRVLIIDADLRRPRIHEVFSVSNDRGLRDLLLERPGPADTPRSFVQETSIPGLFVLPSGPATSSAANLLYSARLLEAIERFRLEFDAIVIDTPPMLQMPDARVVGRLADAVILVIRAAKTTRSEAMAARRRFADDSTEVLGTILNAWNPKNSNSPYGYGKPYRYKGYLEAPGEHS